MRPGVIRCAVGVSLVVIATAAGVGAIRHGSAELREAGRIAQERRVRERAVHDEAARDAAHARAVEEMSQVAVWQREAETLAREIESLRQRLAAPEALPSLKRASLVVPPHEGSVWNDRGRATPASAFETVQWAIDTGEVDALEASITLDEAARGTAASLFASLDAASQAEFRTPEHLVAAIMAAKSRSDLTGAEVLEQSTSDDGTCALRLRIAGTYLAPREISLRFEASPNGWRLRVPAKIITSYRNLLFGPPIDPQTYRVIR